MMKGRVRSSRQGTVQMTPNPHQASQIPRSRPLQSLITTTTTPDQRPWQHLSAPHRPQKKIHHIWTPAARWKETVITAVHFQCCPFRMSVFAARPLVGLLEAVYVFSTETSSLKTQSRWWRSDLKLNEERFIIRQMKLSVRWELTSKYKLICHLFQDAIQVSFIEQHCIL